MARAQPAELYEQRYPVRIRRFALREGSAGPGKYRGGLGAEIELEFLGDEGRLSFIAERGRFGPKGLAGGREGMKTEMIVIQGDEIYRPEHITKDANIPLRKGAIFRQLTPGGGGFGDPLERDPQAVAEDVRLEYITPRQARDDYGVVVEVGADGGEAILQREATDDLRKRLLGKARGS